MPQSPPRDRGLPISSADAAPRSIHAGSGRPARRALYLEQPPTRRPRASLANCSDRRKPSWGTSTWATARRSTRTPPSGSSEARTGHRGRDTGKAEGGCAEEVEESDRPPPGRVLRGQSVHRPRKSRRPESEQGDRDEQRHSVIGLAPEDNRRNGTVRGREDDIEPNSVRGVKIEGEAKIR